MLRFISYSLSLRIDNLRKVYLSFKTIRELFKLKWLPISSKFKKKSWLCYWFF